MADDGESRWAVVTGATGGIGQAIVSELVGRGWWIVATGRSASKLRRLQAVVTDKGSRVVVLKCDVTSRMEVQRMAEATAEITGGRVDALVNNAGVLTGGTVSDLSEDQWEATIATNLSGPWRCFRSLLPLMERSPAPSIVNIASLHASVGFPGRSAYSASKGGLVALSRQLAVELASHGFTVNAVSPGAIETPMNEKLRRDERYFSDLASKIPAQRFGAADEVAAAVAFLLSDRARYVTGHNLVVDGGWSAS